jgi:hypothetical protein
VRRLTEPDTREEPVPLDLPRYAAKIRAAARRADPGATAAQRDAGTARVGKVHLHGLRVSIEYPAGATRRGTGADGKPWSRVVTAPYGYINRTETASDGEQLDVWLGDHPESQLGFLVAFLKADGSFDEWKACLGVRNYREAKKLIDDNYPSDFWADRVGEVRGIFMPEFKKHLATEGLMKKKVRKSAAFLLYEIMYRTDRVRPFVTHAT